MAAAKKETPEAGSAEDGSVTWTASEFIAHDKSMGWYLALATASIVIAGLVFLLTRDKVSVGVILIAGLLLGVYGSHQPRKMEYVVDSTGLSVGDKRHGYHEFKSFSLVEEGAVKGVMFMPLKRFAVPITVYYAPADEEKIMAILSARLPFEEHRADAIDALMRRIRF